MEQSNLSASLRSEKGSSACYRLRQKGFIPAVLYGKKLENLNLSVKIDDLNQAIRSGARMLTLDIEGKTERVLLKAAQFDFLGDYIIHVDFARVAMDEMLEIEVPLVIKGTSKGTEDGGTVEQVLHEVQVSCLPDNIPENITVTITELDINDAIRLRDIQVPEGVSVLGEEDSVVVIVHPPVVTEEADEEAEPQAEEPEVINKKPEEGSAEQEDGQ